MRSLTFPVLGYTICPMMKRLVLVVLSACLLLVFSGCHTIPPRESDSNLIFKYGVGAKNELNTSDGTYTKDMVQDPSITVNLSLSEEELASIYQKMMDIDFFDYPDSFSIVPPPGESRGIVTPYNSYYFKVQHDSGIKELWWEDEIVYEDMKADKLRELIKLILDIIESKEEYRQLPEPTSGYM